MDHSCRSGIKDEMSTFGVVFDSVRTDSIPAHMNLFSDPDQLIINALRRSFKRLVDLRSARYLLLEYFSDVTCARGCLEGEGCDRPNITLPKSQDSTLSVQVDLLRDGFVICSSCSFMM